MLPDSRLDGKATSYGRAGSLRRADGWHRELRRPCRVHRGGKRRLSVIYGRSILRNPLGDAPVHVVDTPVSELFVQQAANHIAAPTAVANDRNGFIRDRNGGKLRHPGANVVASARVEKGQQVTSLNDAGLVPFLRGSDVNDWHPACQQPLERDVVDVSDLRTKRRTASEERDDQEYRVLQQFENFDYSCAA